MVVEAVRHEPPKISTDAEELLAIVKQKMPFIVSHTETNTIVISKPKLHAAIRNRHSVPAILLKSDCDITF